MRRGTRGEGRGGGGEGGGNGHMNGGGQRGRGGGNHVGLKLCETTPSSERRREEGKERAKPPG